MINGKEMGLVVLQNDGSMEFVVGPSRKHLQVLRSEGSRLVGICHDRVVKSRAFAIERALKWKHILTLEVP